MIRSAASVRHRLGIGIVGLQLTVVLIAWLVTGLLAPAFAQSSQVERRDAVVERSWLSDADGTLSPQDVLTQNWTKFDGPLGRGFTNSITWVRLKLDPAVAGPASIASDHRLVLRIVPSRLDEVTAYRVDRLDDPPVKVGDKFKPQGPQQGFLNHGIVFDDAVGPFEVLLRLDTEGNHSIHVEALRWDDAYSRVTRDSILITGYLIFTLMIITWAVVTLLGQRSMVLVLFLAHQFSVLFVVLTLLGAWRLFAPDGLVHLGDQLASFAVPLSVLTTVLFHARLLSDLGARPTHAKILGVSATLPLLGICLIAAGFPQIGLMLSHLTIASLMPFTVFVALRLRVDSGRWWWRPAIAAAYLVMVILMAPAWLRVLGVLPVGAWTFGSTLVYGVVSAILMASLIMVRAREVQRLGALNEAAFAEAKREADLQRARAVEQGDLITMLTHELKTPLSVVSLALGKSGQQPTIQARALTAIENMRSVIDRCAQAARVDDDSTNRTMSLTIEPVQLRAVVTEAVAGLLQGDRVDNQLHDPESVCLADRASVLTIVSNLLDNALKYSPGDSVVRITAQITNLNGRPGATLRITNDIGDQGAPDPVHVFEKYYRGPRARNLSGTGLGLYLSRRLAQRMGGALSLVPAQPSLVGFELWLPSGVESPALSDDIPQPLHSNSRSTQS